MSRHLKGRAALITGGTAGIGLSTGLALARAGAHVYLTHRWGSHDLGEVRAQFAACAHPPTILEADAADAGDTAAVMARIRDEHEALHVVVSNVAFGHVSGDLSDLSARALRTTMRYSAWPLVGHLQAALSAFDAYPRYLVGVSTLGYYPGYIYIAAAKAAVETYCRYLSAALIEQRININIVAAHAVKTASLDATLGEELRDFIGGTLGDEHFIRPEEIADAIVALTSGLLDGVKGHVLALDRGRGFDDCAAGLFARRGADDPKSNDRTSDR